MNLPFTPHQFREVFIAYNTGIWPFQFVLLGAAIAAFALAARGRPGHALSVWLLAALWGWAGLVYHLAFFQTINSAALVFGALFLVQAFVLAASTGPDRLAFRFTNTFEGWLGASAIAYALVVYPLIGYLLGRRYIESPTFGAPCPVTIFTFGMFLWSTRPLRWHEYVIPVAWALVGTSAALQLDMREDLALPVTALAFLYVTIARRPRARPEPVSGLSAAR